jgi:hypothetical protein
MLAWFFNPLGLLAFANVLIIFGSIFVGLRAFRK